MTVDPADHRPAWRQVADAIRDAIVSGALAPGDSLPSVRELSELQGVRTATLQHALSTLAAEGLVLIRQGRTAVVVGEAAAEPAAHRGVRAVSMTASVPGAERTSASR